MSGQLFLRQRFRKCIQPLEEGEALFNGGAEGFPVWQHTSTYLKMDLFFYPAAVTNVRIPPARESHEKDNNNKEDAPFSIHACSFIT
jgi:hypothetical protein